ncbi:MAG: DEAD/DEAH box helicase, partial [bacterium]
MKDVMQAFEPEVRQWFNEAYAAPSPPQVEGWPSIARGENTLIMAPTGSGKTLAAFLWSINLLQRELSAGAEPLAVHTLYISPLKALNYDIQHNLKSPLKEMEKIAGKRLGIRVGVRTGDTS